VVGVVADVRQGGPLGEPGADLYLSNLQLFVPETYLMVRSRGDSDRLLPAVREAIRQVDATQAVFDVRPMSDRVGATIWRQRLASILLQCFGLLALCIAGVGLFGLMRNQVSQQRRALGVRLALGAEPRQLLVSVLRYAGLLAGIGLIAGSLIVLLLGPVVAQTLPGLGAPSLEHGAVAGLALLLLALAAALVPAVTAARLDPAEVLRDE
jgi:predicted lysophospholipase L1 biosynthesis ABC-type transport system permease subunit